MHRLSHNVTYMHNYNYATHAIANVLYQHYQPAQSSNLQSKLKDIYTITL